MAMTESVAAKQDDLVRSARLLGENLSRRTFGERGPDLKVTLSDLEQFLRPVVSAIAEGFLAASANEQSQRLPETFPCPTCGQACPRETREHTLVGEQGPFSWMEPVGHCEHCERSFFPSADRAQD